MHTWGAIFVEMEVDEELGLARMRRCVAGYSAGRIVNPRTARSQMIGGIIWGYGRAMLEESAIDPRYGRYLSKNLSGVMLPVNADIPRDIDVFFIDEHDPHASKLGARGIGETRRSWRRGGHHQCDLPCDRQTYPQAAGPHRRSHGVVMQRMISGGYRFSEGSCSRVAATHRYARRQRGRPATAAGTRVRG